MGGLEATVEKMLASDPDFGKTLNIVLPFDLDIVIVTCSILSSIC